MVGGAARLGEVEPRERAGAQTGRRYEYQYERTARASLDLLVDSPKQVCVYCDWHDDYVMEVGDPPTRYVFHQVKGRSSSQGPWTFSEFFGVRKKKSKGQSKTPPTAKLDAIVPRMLLHRTNFGENCAGLVFVTNAGLDASLSGFIEAIGKVDAEGDLSGEECVAFQHLVRGYISATPPLVPSATALFRCLSMLKVFTDQGQLENADAGILEIADLAIEFSEIDLMQRQAKQIARELVSQVRVKVAHSTTVVPVPDGQLKHDKGIATPDLLNILSLSAQAYEQLKAGTSRDTVKTLSRLHRYCLKHAMEPYLMQICEFKTRWDVWRTVERHFIGSADYLLLERKARDVIKANLTIDEIVAEAKDIAKQFASITATRLTPECVLGLIFSLAAQSEARPGVQV
jgi:hypothetical protein